MDKTMNEELQTKLLEALQATMSTVDDIKDMAVEQLPDLLQQAITWYGIYYFILFLSGLTVFIALYVITYYVLKKALASKEDNILRQFSSYYNSMSVTDLGVTAFIATGILNLLIPMAYVALFNLQWLKIYVAPKLWLTEYIATIAKG